MIDAITHPKHFKADWPFYWISQLNAAYADALERRIRPIGIDIPRWRALMSLYEDQYLSVSEIAAFSAQKLNTTTKLIQRMIKDEMVTTRPRPTDGRVTEVCLTEKGDRLRKLALVEARAIYDLTFAKIDPERVAEMNRLMSEMHTALRKL
ncbi:MarR family winged helix-turn-helix transcriptional regulator [Sagittula stellata]|uniref:Putative transcriptional repressor of for multidrug resistance pump (MarR family) protein n=1 Tax=Sagittula stellata (strain ATCC 700073 / DSM 11524 / E-37) TaxID=388399 RepID=A3K7B7_SAGS3|nr:MarR family transcriptional regulator [Sagittula stellata]EBA06876.1 putative transcriptional repressor of for multidrug resistance pump (MarR family) protein [Sagittula stellata E-37]